MSPPIQFTAEPWSHTYSEIIDVRSPAEFAEDHWPGAINLPVLQDAERAEVGTLYKQVDPFTARKRGASLVAQNISRHLQTHFADKDRDYRPLIYCWRGGQRSGSLALVLSQVGWLVTVLEGGYKTYRAWVRRQLQTLPQQFTYRVLCGATGSGKTQLLHQLQVQGAQVLDLEGLARHRGSLLGAEWQLPQPSQKGFESRLLQAFLSWDPTKWVWVESESAKVGQLHLPPALWQALTEADCIEVQLPLQERVQGIIAHYPHWIAHPQALKQKLWPLKARYGQACLQWWFELIDAQNWSVLVQELLEQHYDPTYRHGLQRYFNRIRTRIELPNLSEDSLKEAARQLLTDSSLARSAQ
ncbi:tRNA 2-selenouridine(34) synthase MnmH [Thermostichus vulcanus]|uniref:tRNA 2-selenouridine(34) synthase MnmH n=1 Tax=Thermostichus vulcanus str. 'Rupite' TaxID=2813851 RepID=A0ABT0CD64_THEVL|nr:tRNA 2-selenouridine(34) synthase MnmH [Thermostichus vulcanus str. 'Rupite']